MLHDFIVENRELIIQRARERVRLRMSRSTEAKLSYGVPVFLGQLALALAYSEAVRSSRVDDVEARKKIVESAEEHGRDLLRNGFAVAHVVHGYGDVCQVVTELAGDSNAAISPEEFQVFNRCLDDAIAGAVTAYGREREVELAIERTERLGVLAHELRNLLGTAMLSFDVIKRGTVGLGGSTAAVHSRSLARLHALVERALAEVRLEAGVPKMERVSLLEFVEEMEIGATMQAESQGVQLRVEAFGGDTTIAVDRQLLASAVTNLIQNAFKFTRHHGTVVLTTRLTPDRALIEISDECGGLPAGRAEQLFLPFVRGGPDQSGLGLGLSIALSAVKANSGDLRVRDVPAHGCVFTVDLPRQLPTTDEAV